FRDACGKRHRKIPSTAIEQKLFVLVSNLERRCIRFARRVIMAFSASRKVGWRFWQHANVGPLQTVVPWSADCRFGIPLGERAFIETNLEACAGIAGAIEIDNGRFHPDRRHQTALESAKTFDKARQVARSAVGSPRDCLSRLTSHRRERPPLM